MDGAGLGCTLFPHPSIGVATCAQLSATGSKIATTAPNDQVLLGVINASTLGCGESAAACYRGGSHCSIVVKPSKIVPITRDWFSRSEALIAHELFHAIFEGQAVLNGGDFAVWQLAKTLGNVKPHKPSGDISWFIESSAVAAEVCVLMGRDTNLGAVEHPRRAPHEWSVPIIEESRYRMYELFTNMVDPRGSLRSGLMALAESFGNVFRRTDTEVRRNGRLVRALETVEEAAQRLASTPYETYSQVFRGARFGTLADVYETVLKRRAFFDPEFGDAQDNGSQRINVAGLPIEQMEGSPWFVLDSRSARFLPRPVSKPFSALSVRLDFRQLNPQLVKLWVSSQTDDPFLFLIRTPAGDISVLRWGGGVRWPSDPGGYFLRGRNETFLDVIVAPVKTTSTSEELHRAWASFFLRIAYD